MADHTHDDVGAELLGPPAENDNVAGWKEFLKRPENLATALVLLAGITGPRGQGQTKLNKTLQSGVGALGFRGGLDKGIEADRAASREEGRTIEAQDAEIAAQQAATAVSEGNLAVNQGTLDINQQLADQAGQARPLAPSAIALNQARSDALGRDPNAVPDDFNSLFSRNIELFLNSNPNEQPPMAQIAVDTTKQLLFAKLGEEGRISAAGIDATPEEAAILGIPIPDLDDDDDDTTTTAAVKLPDLAVSGRDVGFFDEHLGKVATAKMLRDQGDLGEQSDKEILDTLAEIRKLAQSEEELQRLPVKRLREILEIYATVMSPSEARRVRRVILEKSNIVQPRGQRITNRRSFQ